MLSETIMSIIPPPYNDQLNSQNDSQANPDQLPSYEPEGAGAHGLFVPSLGIDDKLPNHFRIGKQYTTPLIQCSDLQAHLILLGAFHRLREEVRSHKGAEDFPLTPNERWAVYLERAAHRFERWVTRMIGDDGDVADTTADHPLLPNQIPPLDVTLVWHSYMLNPRTYYEDCLRKFPGLLRIGSVHDWDPEAIHTDYKSDRSLSGIYVLQSIKRRYCHIHLRPRVRKRLLRSRVYPSKLR